MTISKVNDPKFYRNLENCIKYGRVCVVEGLGLQVDPLLEPILLKQLIKKGNHIWHSL